MQASLVLYFGVVVACRLQSLLFQGAKLGLLSIRPPFCLGSLKAFTTLLVYLISDFPEVIVVFHILPEPNSLEYKLMKELADEYDLIRQGVLLEKAITRFEGCDMKEVLGNILQWFSRRISRFIALEKKLVSLMAYASLFTIGP